MEEISFSHYSVLLKESIEGLAIKTDGVYVDGTAGGAGHSAQIASRLSGNGLLLALDQDETAVKVATERLKPYGARARVIHSNFKNLEAVLAEQGISHIDGLLLDLGSHYGQLIVRMSLHGFHQSIILGSARDAGLIEVLLSADNLLVEVVEGEVDSHLQLF